jgi:ABC-2 type transport system ATP-binding protein
MREIALQTTNLTKQYNNFTALDHVDMTVYRGDIYGLIGRNGAGKTTAMKIVTGLTEASDGTFSVFGKKGREAMSEKRRLGCLIENPAFFGGMTAWQNLKYYALQKGIADLSQIDEALKLVQLEEAKHKKFRKFSLGMKQRLGIAFALMDNPDLIILDEPINGLDPIGISQLREIFNTLNRQRGITLMISSHILSELYIVANRFLFVDKGKVLKEITKEELDQECARSVAVTTKDTKRVATLLEQKGINDYKVVDGERIRIYDQGISTGEINSYLVKQGAEILEIGETGVSLEDYFKSLIGES